ncbi:hypothetical protein [Caproiciproducens sp.]
MKKQKRRVFTLFCALALALTACGGAAPGSSGQPESSPSSAPQLSGVSVSLYADFSAGNPDGEAGGRVKRKTVEMDAAPSVEALADALSEWSGLDFSLASARTDANGAYADWSAASTLVRGLDDREQKEDFHFFDSVSLNWFMMDSLARTVKANLPVKTVYYSMDGGKELRFTNPEDMAAQGLPALPADQPYEGSAFFVTHSGGSSGGDDEPPYWDGLDFGPNLEYSEEYKLQGDPGDYLNAAEAGKRVFETLRDGGHIPNYSKDKDYKMVLVNLDTVENQECYLYRLDGSLLSCAYAYQSGGVYYQDGGKWVLSK